MHRLLGGTLFLIVVLFSTLGASAQTAYDSYTQRCYVSEAEYYQPNVFVRYEFRNQRLLLVDWTTAEIVREVETGLAVPELRVNSWSPDCHYFSANIYENGDTNFVIWDAVDGGRVHTFENARRSTLGWDPTSTYLGVLEDERVDPEVNVVNVRTGAAFGIERPYRGYGSVIWDTETSRLMYNSYLSSRFNVYNVNNGQKLYELVSTRGGYWATVNFSSNGQYLILGTSEDVVDVFPRSGDTPILSVDVGYRSWGRADISPDARYLALYRNHWVQVWDTQNLELDPVRQNRDAPLYEYFVGLRPTELAFDGNTTLTVTLRDDIIYRWDMTTGETIRD